DIISNEYRMSDGSPYQGSHFREQSSPHIGLMDPAIAGGETWYPNYFLSADLNMFDAIGWDYPPCAAPSINTQPQPFDGCVGDTIVLSISASGGSLTYQWRIGSTNLVNGGRISGATSATLTITGALESDSATNYNCVVSLNGCPAISTDTAVTISGDAEFLNQPFDANAPEGGTAAFNVLVTGWQDYTFQWRRNGVPLTNDGRISGATTQGLLIDPVQLSDAGTYDCLATSAAGCETLSNSATLTVVAQCTQAQITQQPANQTACSGDTVALSVSATGTSLGYQWRRGTTNLSNDGHFSGVTTPTLTISNAVPGDSGTDYNCVVTSGGSCPVTSNNATVTINAYPSITQQPGSSSVCEGGTIMLSVGATGGSLSYQWRRGTTNLNDGGRISGATTAALTITGALPSDAGSDYNCVITSAGLCGVTSNNGSVSVESPAVILGQPQDLTVDEGDNASFTVTVQNPGSYTYRWRKDGNDLSDGGSISGSGTSSLLITGVVQGDAGDYDCVISGTLCDVVSAAATLTVNAPEPCPEDLDGDGVVGLPDLSILLTNFGGPGTAAEGDITGDGQVDLADLSALLTAYGTTCP
ncbi:MAG: immunoglobulin domain-containing protein, partial [Phycisphaerae bacterium]